ncbi:MAG: DNA polymerase III subunit delta [Pseudomonadales bacterium]
MQVKPVELPGAVERSLAPIYLVAGDDTLLVQEACDTVLAAARAQGYSERSVLHVDGSFSWNDVVQDAASMSLFAERRVIDVRVPGAKFDREASEVLRGYAERPAEETVLLIRSGRLEARQRSAAWFKALDAAGVVVQVWPLDLRDLPRWLEARLERAGLRLEGEALALLAERVEGNLLAAVQEIEKLRLAGLDSPITAAGLAAVLDDSARYDAFELIDATLGGDAVRVSRMLATLRQEGVALFAILGALTSQLRRIADGGYLPPPRKRLIGGFLNRIGSAESLPRVLAECALVDAQGKGQIPGDAWLSLEEVLLRLAGVRAVAGGSPIRHLR